MADSRNIRVSILTFEDNTDLETIGVAIETTLDEMGISCLVDVKEVE